MKLVEKWKKKITQKYCAFKEDLKNTAYFIFFRRCKIRTRVAFLESRSGDDLAGNLYYLAEELSKREIKVLIGYKKKHKGKIDKILKNGNFSNVKLVEMYSYGYYFALATAKYLATDVCFDWKYIKRDGQVVVNTWHGTPLKTIGFDVPKEKYVMGNIQRCLMMTDYIVSPSEYFSEKMLSSFHVDNIFAGKLLCAGYPRNARFMDEQAIADNRAKYGLAGKKVVVYMPTWRGSHANPNQQNQLQQFLEEIDRQLTSEQEFYVKLHNMDRQQIFFSRLRNIKEFPENVECYEFLAMADCLITDYSSVFFDFANTRKKIVLFTYDDEEYLKGRGLYFSMDELPFPRVKTVDAIMQEVNSPKSYDDTEFRRKFCTYDRSDAAEQIVKCWLGEKSDLEEQSIVPNGKKNVLLYCGGINMKNGIITSLKNILSILDADKVNLFFSFVRPGLSAQPQLVTDLRPEIQLYPIASPLQKTVAEAWAYRKYFGEKKRKRIYLRYWERLMCREVKKHFPVSCFDTVIDFEGYGTHHMIPILQRYPGKRVIFVHNDMVQEINVRKNQHPYILQEAYAAVDVVAVVSESLLVPTKNIGGRDDNIQIVNNSHDYRGFQRKALMPITLDKDTEVVTPHSGGLEGVLSQKGYKFITIGRFSPEKGHVRLLDAFDLFCDRYGDAHLIIVGGHGNLYAATLKRIKRMKHWRNVTVVKSISNPMPILKRCDLFVLSSLYEGLGLVLLEADCLGIPSFSTDIVGPRDFLRKYKGHLVHSSTAGILQGMYDFVDGKVHTYDIDYETYNRNALEEFERLYFN